jgi:hypothetical protein
VKLNDSHLVTLSNASQRGDRCIQIPPATTRGAAEKSVAKLVGAGLLEEIETIGGAPVWREVEGQRYSMRVTDKGMEAIGIGPEAPTSPQQKRKKPARPTPRRTGPNPSNRKSGVKTRRKAAKTVSRTRRQKAARVQKPRRDTDAQRPGTKVGEILHLLSRKRGATIDEIVVATGWQAHSVRGALSGTIHKKLGHTILTEKQGDTRRYRIARG